MKIKLQITQAFILNNKKLDWKKIPWYFLITFSRQLYTWWEFLKVRQSKRYINIKNMKEFNIPNDMRSIYRWKTQEVNSISQKLLLMQSAKMI